MDTVLLAVNGTLMRGFPLENNLIRAGAVFLRDDDTARSYRLYSIRDVHPGMVRVGLEDPNAVSVAVEIWEVPAANLASVLLQEPPGLSIGKVLLKSGDMVLGVIAEPELVKDQKEISSFGGWRAYSASLREQIS